MSRPKISGERVHEARSEAGLSQEALARRMRCSVSTIEKYERGKRGTSPTPRLLAKLAKATGKPESFFLIDEAA